MNYIKKFQDIRLTDTPLVGGKTASLGEMISHLTDKGVLVPDGFAITAQAYTYYIKANDLLEKIKNLLAQIKSIDDEKTLHHAAHEVRQAIERATMPDDLQDQIIKAYKELSTSNNQTHIHVAVRSSATAEDLPGASFAGQQETYLNVHGTQALLEACKKCFASLFTDRAIAYRVDKGFDHFNVALSIGVQKMVRSDLGCSGVAFSLDTESGFKDVVTIDASWGLGEMIVQGSVIPDEFVVYKPALEKDLEPILKKRLGQKEIKLVYTNNTQNPVKIVDVPVKDRGKFCLTDQEILQLARSVVTIEDYYSKLNNRWCPMDVEWAQDGNDKKIYIVQARPETVFSQQKKTDILTTYTLKNRHKAHVLSSGQSIGQKISSGPVRIVKSAAHSNQVKKGDIIVTQMTDPSWVPAMKRAAGIITDRGGRTCHAAIVSRELGIPAIVGVEHATTTFKNDQQVTLDCSTGDRGFVYEGTLEFKQHDVELKTIPKLSSEILVNIADPDSAFATSRLPVSGVGLARIEFIITNTIQIHPMALIDTKSIKDKKIVDKIHEITADYADRKTFFVDSLAQGIGMIAAAFYPRKVIVRFSDLKSNEYRDLIGGSYFEPAEENPMLGFRGASRYYDERYKQAFALECEAIVKARDKMGFTNIAAMIPFVRTVDEAKNVLKQLKQAGLVSSADFKIFMMVEIPSNVLLIDQFSNHFDGFSIGSNDLTQLTLGVDRDSEILAPLFDERDAAVKKMMELAVLGARANKRYIGICGQAPSDYPEIADFLMDLKIDSLSLNQDAILPFFARYAKK